MTADDLRARAKARRDFGHGLVGVSMAEADALADLIDFVKTVEQPGCNNQPSCIERPPRSGLMCLPCSATQALDALDADR